MKPHQLGKKKTSRAITAICRIRFSIPDTVLCTAVGILFFAFVACSSSEKKDSPKNPEYIPAYQAHGPIDAAVAGIAMMMFSNPQAGSTQEKDQIGGKCKIAAKTVKDSNVAAELCNGVEVFLYTPDGRILQRTWAFDGAYRFKVAREGPYTIKAKSAQLNMEAQWEGARRGQRLNIEFVKK